ncbi:MAG TPA: hypothetical protein VKC60_06225 [Opitutaceae bacterium]|nr:hypothetical protein [Opitutaceae bacterium]
MRFPRGFEKAERVPDGKQFWEVTSHEWRVAGAEAAFSTWKTMPGADAFATRYRCAKFRKNAV